ncbi:MAG TPA: hypothetical protein VKD71_12285 [Gemmataceae bacterium]|nr:hypothetical protein [Gemmataceae bacterium]
MADPPKKRKRGPKGGTKHTPGRGHTRKSGPNKKKRFQAKARRKKAAEVAELAAKQAIWDALSPEVQELRPELKPD